MKKAPSDPNLKTPTKLPSKAPPPECEGHRQRMRQELLNAKDHQLPDRKLLELLLFYSIPRRDTRDTAIYLLRSQEKSMMKVFSADQGSLTAVPGIGLKSARMLRTVGAVVRRLMQQDTKKVPAASLTESHEIAEMFMKSISSATGTETWVASFSSAMQLQHVTKLTDGELHPRPMDMRILLDFMSLHRTKHIALAKICPGDSRIPTAADLELASHAAKIFYRIGANVVEYVIINDSGYTTCSQYIAL